MKKLLALAVFATTTGAFAASNSAINDLQYLPDQGTFFGETNLNYIRFSNEISDLKVSVEGFSIGQTIGYSVMNNFSVSADFFHQNVKTRVEGESSTEATGLGDIDLNGRYRLKDSDHRLDLLATLSISPGDSETKSDGDSNSYSGGNSILVGAEYGAKMEHHQWAVRGTLTHNFKATEDNKQDDVKTKNDAHNALGFAAQLLTKVGEKCYIRNFAGVDFTEKYDDNQDGKTRGSSDYNLGTEYQHLLSKDVFVKVGATAAIPGNGSSSVVMLYNLGANYQF